MLLCVPPATSDCGYFSCNKCNVPSKMSHHYQACQTEGCSVDCRMRSPSMLLCVGTLCSAHSSLYCNAINKDNHLKYFTEMQFGHFLKPELSHCGATNNSLIIKHLFLH